MNTTVDHTIEYNKGWSAANELFKLGELPDAILAAHQAKSSFDIGACDCVQQYLKAGTGEMIKIASVVIVIDPDTGKVLAATRRGTTDDWGFIGGKTDGEAPLEAAIREFEEETGVSLISVPEYIGCFKDDEDWNIHVYISLDAHEARYICDKFRSGPCEIEPGILVGLVPYSELMVKTFAQFNIDLIPYVLKTLL